MSTSTRLTFLLFLAITAATARASWAPGDIRFGQPALQATAGKAQTPAGQAPRILAIRNVTVIPGNGAPPLENATVLIRDDRIAAIGPAAETVIPTGARSIEGAGEFLVPGFIEMHAHLSKARASALGLFVANGVTTLREQLLERIDGRLHAWRKVWEDVIRRDLREMHEAGMDLLVGSDVSLLNIFPGYSIHDEMALFVTELGMTPAEVIERATSRSARFLRIADSVGTVERGKVADLVLLEANPLQDIRNTRRIAAVILRGALYDSSSLDRILADGRAAPDRQVDDWGRKSSARDRK